MYPILADLASILQTQYGKEARGVTGWKWGWRLHPIEGDQSWHNGLDLPAPTGTPIYNPLAGVVEHIQSYDDGKSGLFLRISHNDPENPDVRMTRYAHLSGFASGLSVGQRVSKGQLVAYVGNSGASTGPHLHFIINTASHATADGMRIDADPLPYLETALKKGLGGGAILGGGLILAALLYKWYTKH